MTDRDRLIELLQDCETEKVPDKDGYYRCYMSREKGESYADYLIANGVILSPVDIGKTVYKVSRIGKIVSLNVVNYDCDVITSPYDLISFNSFGKTVFLNREEAEKELERSKDNAEEKE